MGGGNKQWGSWIDCCQALRSPGSALKPFVYFEAFRRGLLPLLPSCGLASSFGGLAPKL